MLSGWRRCLLAAAKTLLIPAMGACLWEFMAHAQRIVILLHRLLYSIPLDTEFTADTAPDLPHFRDAWERCFTRFKLWQSMMTVVQERQVNSE